MSHNNDMQLSGVHNNTNKYAESAKGRTINQLRQEAADIRNK